MDKRRAEALAMVVIMVLSMVAWQADAAYFTSFRDCYIVCYVLCAIQPTQTLSSCAFSCLRDCIIPPNSTNVTPFHFCNLGCASSHCTNISTPRNPGGKEVEGCVNSCSGLCRNGYMAP
ncbi:hypothetical protein Ancab_022784 [Ancistrocladus abbreviatus]